MLGHTNTDSHNDLGDLSEADVKILELMTRRLMVEVRKGNKRRAHQLLDRYAVQLDSKHSTDYLDLILANIGVPERTLNMLPPECVTIGDVLRYTQDELMSARLFNKGTLLELNSILLSEAIKRIHQLELERLRAGELSYA